MKKQQKKGVRRLAFRLDTNSRGFSVRGRDDRANGIVALDRVGGSVVVNGRLRSLTDAAARPCVTGASNSHAVTCAFPEAGFTWKWAFKVTDRAVEVVATIVNTGGEPLEIGAWNVLHLETARGGRIRAGKQAGDLRFFGWRPWDMCVERLSAGEGSHSSSNLCHVCDAESGSTWLCGFTTLDRMGCHHFLRYSKRGGISEYRATCEFGKYRLPPGGRLMAEKLILGFHADPYAALEEWADRVHARYRPSFAELPPVGWIDGAWPDAVHCWEKVALANAAAIREKLRGFDVRYIWTSQANLKNAIPGNWLNVDRKQIPSGLKGFFRQLNRKGFLPGLWVAPYWFFSEADGVLNENRENVLRDAEGKPICETTRWGWSYGDDQPWYRMHQYFLDGTHPRTMEFLRKVFGQYRRLGVRYYMLDFLGIVDNCRLHDPSSTPLQAGRAMLEVVRKTAGADTHIQTAVSSTPGYVGLIDAARVGRDFGEGRPLQGVPLSDWRNATYVLHDLHYANTRYLLQNAAANYFTHRKLYLNDFNLLSIDKPVPLEHARIVVTMFGLGGGSPLMLGDDYRRIDADRLRMVKLCLPRTRDSARPVDLFDHVHPDDYCRMLKLAVRTAWDSWLLVAVFNLDDQPYRTQLDFEKLGLDAAAAHRVYEFWNEEYVGTFRRSLPCVIPPGTCRLYRIAKARPYPWLLATDLHAQQGAVEVKALEWNAKKRLLSGTVCRPAGENGSLFFLMPRKMRLINHEGVSLMKELVDLNVVMRKPVHFRRGVERFELFFEPWELPCVSPHGLMPFATEKEWLRYTRRNRQPGDTRVFE
jgi:hypothetical protein